MNVCIQYQLEMLWMHCQEACLLDYRAIDFQTGRERGRQTGRYIVQHSVFV